MSMFLLGKGIVDNVNSPYFNTAFGQDCQANNFVDGCPIDSSDPSEFDNCISQAMGNCRSDARQARVAQIVYISLYVGLCLLKVYEFYLMYQGTLQTPDVIFKFKSKLLLAWIIDKVPNLVFALSPIAWLVPANLCIVKIFCSIIGYKSSLDLFISFLGLHTGFIRGSGECVQILHELLRKDLSAHAQSSIRAFVGILQGSTFYMCCLIVFFVGAIGGIFIQTTSTVGLLLYDVQLARFGEPGKELHSWSRMLYSDSTLYWVGISIFAIAYFGLIALFKIRDVGKVEAEQYGRIIRFTFHRKQHSLPAKKLAAYVSMILGMTLFLIWTCLHGLMGKLLQFLLDSFLEYYASRTFTTIIIADNLIACFVYLVPECESEVTGAPSVCSRLFSPSSDKLDGIEAPERLKNDNELDIC
jgi:hypothetical protein